MAADLPKDPAVVSLHVSHGIVGVGALRCSAHARHLLAQGCRLKSLKSPRVPQPL
ncbi:hypothetical protein BAUCODRAFT_36815 [Baudoinia panamericana UAMH 10762]|uniref:Uncharacterized protein n=1 Tax=Baudoinia panamericana (strain UAMH 10762) TaxID=717646 RepID=M2M9P1_BAUPA|nr:uncharacterized protein BAUCODRAFT_36815 [Baudoinia panamericana UAMH 10762]EMC93146.1 hypothetical protein BAUCODRAFT_36815 [Baudoinia panamericana UAMH 10762]